MPTATTAGVHGPVEERDDGSHQDREGDGLAGEDRAAGPPDGRPDCGVVDRWTRDDGAEHRPGEHHASQ